MNLSIYKNVQLHQIVTSVVIIILCNCFWVGRGKKFIAVLYGLLSIRNFKLVKTPSFQIFVLISELYNWIKCKSKDIALLWHNIAHHTGMIIASIYRVSLMNTFSGTVHIDFCDIACKWVVKIQLDGVLLTKYQIGLEFFISLYSAHKIF